MYPTLPKTNKNFLDTSILSSAKALNLDRSKILPFGKGLEAFTDNTINVTENLKSVLGWVENIEGKGENAGYQHFFFPKMILEGFFLGSLKVWIAW